MGVNIKQINGLEERLGNAPSASDAINNYIEGKVVYPEPIEYNGTNRSASDEATLLSAISASSAGDIITLTADIDLTAKLVINKSIKLDGAFILQSSADGSAPTNLIEVTADDVYITSNVTIKHRKTTNTSVEVALIGNGERFISKATLEFMEFGYQLHKSFNIGGKTKYTGALGNSHRHIAIYNIENPSIINELVYDSPNEGTVRCNVILVTSASNSEWNDVLKVVNVSPQNPAYTIRQFFMVESFLTSGNPAFIIENCYFNDVNGGIGLYDGGGTISPLDFFDYIALICNRQGDAGSASYKGMMYVDGAGTGIALGDTRFYAVGNKTAITALRSTNTTALENTLLSYTTAAFTNLIPLTKKTNTSIKNSLYNYLQGFGSTTEEWKLATYAITTGTSAETSTLTLSSGALSNGGASTKAGDRIEIPSSTVFNKDSLSIYINGIEQLKGTDVTYTSAGVVTITLQLEIGDIIAIKDYQ